MLGSKQTCPHVREEGQESALEVMARDEKVPAAKRARGNVFQTEGTQSEKAPCPGKHYALLKG